MNQLSLTGALLFINILCMGLTMTLTQWFSIIEVIAIDYVHIYLNVLVSIGIICMIIILSG